MTMMEMYECVPDLVLKHIMIIRSKRLAPHHTLVTRNVSTKCKNRNDKRAAVRARTSQL